MESIVCFPNGKMLSKYCYIIQAINDNKYHLVNIFKDLRKRFLRTLEIISEFTPSYGLEKNLGKKFSKSIKKKIFVIFKTIYRLISRYIKIN